MVWVVVVRAPVGVVVAERLACGCEFLAVLAVEVVFVAEERLVVDEVHSPGESVGVLGQALGEFPERNPGGVSSVVVEDRVALLLCDRAARGPGPGCPAW